MNLDCNATVNAVKGILCKKARVLRHERAIVYRHGEAAALLGPGVHFIPDLFGAVRIDIHDIRRPMLPENGLDLLVKSGLLEKEAEVLNLDDNCRALVWMDGRFAGILGPGLHAYWTGMANVRIETVDIRENDGALEHPALSAILSLPGVGQHLTVFDVPAEARGALFRNGALLRLVQPGRHAVWKGLGEHAWVCVDLREATQDISGQDMLTADKLTIRVNATLSYRVTDAAKSLVRSSDARQALYREAQLLLRTQVGCRELDSLLADKNSLAAEMEKALRDKAAAYGMEIVSFGVRDIILPGDIRELLIKATEAKKASEAATIARREETAAMRHQLNTARLLAENPFLMRLRELETLEKVAASSKLKVIMGDKKLAETVTTLI